MTADNQNSMPLAEIVTAELEVSPLPGVDDQDYSNTTGA
jgi:hypothetical protein